MEDSLLHATVSHDASVLEDAVPLPAPEATLKMLDSRQAFLRSAASAWSRVGEKALAASLSRSADLQMRKAQASDEGVKAD